MRRGFASDWCCSVGSAVRRPQTPDASTRTSCSSARVETFVKWMRLRPRRIASGSIMPRMMDALSAATSSVLPAEPLSRKMVVSREQPFGATGGHTVTGACRSQAMLEQPPRAPPRRGTWTATRAARGTAPCESEAVEPTRQGGRSTPAARTRRASFRLSNGDATRTAGDRLPFRSTVPRRPAAVRRSGTVSPGAAGRWLARRRPRAG